MAAEETERRTEASTELPGHVENLIVGAGFGGLCAAIKLGEAGREYLVIERADDVGGTWRDNSYPGCACDVPSHLYSYSFAPNPDWRHSFSRQPQILDYLRGVARDRGVLPHVRLRTSLTAARWDQVTSSWAVETSRGTLTADRLVVATGPLSEPSIPTIPGLNDFQGETFHSATWNSDHNLTGERVAVIGTGASAIQFVPHVQELASRMTLFQRTAPWVLPRRDRGYRRWERRLNRILPVVQRSLRTLIYAARELMVIGFARPQLMKRAERLMLRHLFTQVTDPELRRKLTPSFRLGCKRVLMSNTYYPALAADNAEVVTDAIVEVLPHAIITESSDGRRAEHLVDTIIFGTGFRVTDPPVAELIWGPDGRRLSDVWADEGMAALHGLAISGFPNLFMLVGPNTGLGHTSIVLMIEAQVGYLVKLLEAVDATEGRAVDAKASVQAAYNVDLQQRLAGTVWNAGGCQSWYLDRQGRNTTLWPTFTFSYLKEMRSVDLTEYDVTRTVGSRTVVPA